MPIPALCPLAGALLVALDSLLVLTSEIVGWIDISAADASRLRRFYGDLLGWRAVVGEAMDYGPVSDVAGAPVGGIDQVGGRAAIRPVYLVVAVLRGCRSALRLVASVVATPGVRMGPNDCEPHAHGAGGWAGAQGFVLITWPDGESTYHSPPLRFRPCPVALPGAVSETKVYRGQPA